MNLPKHNWKLLDQNYNYYYHDNRIKIAHKIGYNFISEATIKLYRKHQSTIIVAKLLGLSAAGVRSELIKNQEPLRSRGGCPSII